MVSPFAIGRELVELNPAIVFCHEDFSFAAGEPERRRFFFDQTASLVSVGYIDALREYRRILKQRNALLREGQGRQGPPRSSRSAIRRRRNTVGRCAPAASIRIRRAFRPYGTSPCPFLAKRCGFGIAPVGPWMAASMPFSRSCGPSVLRNWPSARASPGRIATDGPS